MKKVGLIGVGNMGKGLLKNLMKHDCEVMAFDVLEKGKEDTRAIGGLVASHPREVAQYADVIFLSLPNPQIVKELFTGPEGIAEVLQANTRIMDLSTIDPKTTRELAALCRQYDSYFFDCPVSGGPAGADQGTLTIMVGGPAEQYEIILEYLQYVGLNIKYIGESGMAQAMKLCHNIVGAINTVALGESFATGVKYGLNVEVMADVIGKSLGCTRTLEYFGPNIVQDTYENVKFALAHMQKDAELFITMAREAGVPAVVSTNTYGLYSAAKNANKGHLDHTAVCQVIEDMADVKIVKNNGKFVERIEAEQREETKKVGLIGVGAMGKGLLKNLIKNGCEVLAFDISEKGKETIRELGGLVASHPREVAQYSNVIFMSLPGPKEIKELFLGVEGIAEVLMNGTKIMDLSTIDPTTVHELAAVCSKYDATFLDCPVSGGPVGADTGTLTIMCSGPQEEFAKVEHYLHYVGSNISYIGESGLAQALKLCHNMLGAANIVALGEAYATGVKYGLTVEMMADVFLKGMSYSRTLEYFGPNIVNNTYENVKFALNHMHKDLGLYVRMTQQAGVPSLIGANVYNLYQAAKYHGKGHLDHSAVCQIIEELASVKLVEGAPASTN